ncbi:rod shape-determining protein MreC [Cohnella sp. CFH 77786]|uniref:rod shape-determining protein MreC n=1 Tax=Cohnella sp. CFH 77786 TaxID=2662265 RepID=UPI001C60EB2D|nr:rod shape-determining protein MreC [Cohnella sp. CFH 77786]MBW5447861.1 rod shape-determining protein MreC [Cohnella sp. CFH 77786]
MRNKRLFILMIGLIVFIAVMGFTLGRTRLTWPEKFLNDAVGTVQGALYRPVGAVVDFFGDLGRLSDVYKENQQLRQTVAQYAQDQATYNFIEAENERLKEELNFTERQKQLYKYRYLIAQVVGSSSNPLDRTIKINLGARDGIKPQMAVTTTDGLVGLVSRVSEFTSTVEPITELDPESPQGVQIAATIFGKEKDSFGIIDSYDAKSGMLQMVKIDENDKMAVGDKVITSGLGNVFPRGIVIGTVVNRQDGDFGLTQKAMVEPAAKFDHLQEVFVVAVPDVNGP